MSKQSNPSSFGFTTYEADRHNMKTLSEHLATQFPGSRLSQAAAVRWALQFAVASLNLNGRKTP